MRKLFGGVVALALAATGSLALAAPGSTQEEPPVELQHLDATLSPTEAAPGDDVTVTPVENCSVETGFLVWAVFPEGVFSWEDEGNEAEPLLSDFAELAEDGSWEVTFAAPDPAAPVDAAPFDAQALAEEEDPFAVGVYGPEAFTSGDTAYEWFGYCLEIELPEFVHLDADLTQVGDDVTVTPVDNCSATEGVIFWYAYRAGEFGWGDLGGAEPVGGGVVDLEADGSWQLEFSAAEAVAGFPEEDFAAAAEDEEEPFVVEVYGPEAFTSGGADYEWFAECVELVEPLFLEAEITSHEPHPVLGFPLVNQGDEITVGPVDPCPDAGSDDSLFWEVDTWPLDDEEPEMIDAGYLDVADDGTWELKFPTPDDEDDAKVTFYAVWLDCETTDEVTGLYDLLLFAVGEAPATPPTEEPTEPVGPKPAHPVVRPPDQTG